MTNEDELKGVFDEIGKLVREVGTKPTDLSTAVGAAALIVRNYAITDAPYKTGTLRRSIAVGGEDSIERTQTTRQYCSMVIGTSLPYAARIEFGYMDKRDALGRLYHQVGRPYLGPAVNNHKPEIRREMAEAYRDVLLARLRRRKQ